MNECVGVCAIKFAKNQASGDLKIHMNLCELQRADGII